MHILNLQIRWILFTIFSFCVFFTNLAHASLGGDWKDLRSESRALSLTAGRSKVMGNLRTHEQSLDGFSVKQFAGAMEQKIFAVSWSGRFNEKIETLLGDYASALKATEQNHPPRAGRIHYRKVVVGDMIVEFWDLPKMVKGRAYLPKFMPSSISTDDLQ